MVSDHVMTYIRAWSVTPTSTLILLGGNFVPGPSVCRGFVSLLSLLQGSVDYLVSVGREYRLSDDKFPESSPS